MKTRERTIYLGALGVATLVNVTLFLGGTGSQAFASARAWIADTLGPTEAVRFVEEGAEDESGAVDLKLKDGHLAYGDEAHQQIHSTAFMHVGQAMAAMLSTEEFQERRQELQDELRATAEEYDANLGTMVEELQGMDEQDPSFADKQQQASLYYQEFQQWNQQAQQRSAQLEADLIAEAYEEIIAAVDVVALEKGIDVVMRFIPQGESVAAPTPQQAQLIIRNRTALKYPDGLDITADVMDELNLETE